MLALIISVVIGAVIGYFATQNTANVEITFVNYSWKYIPLYWVVIGSLLSGLFIAWLVSLIGSLSSFLKIQGKETTIKEEEKKISELTKRVHQLELENTRLKTEKGEPVTEIDDKSL